VVAMQVADKNFTDFANGYVKSLHLHLCTFPAVDKKMFVLNV
jgi:hypothetical protein